MALGRQVIQAEHGVLGAQDLYILKLFQRMPEDLYQFIASLLDLVCVFSMGHFGECC